MQMETAFAVPFMKRDNETFYNYCLSFSPAAPFFGVPWRFAAGLKIVPDAPKAGVEAAQAVIDDAVLVTEKVAETLEAAVKVMAAGIAAEAANIEAPADDVPVEAAPVEAAPVEAAPVEAVMAEAAPVEAVMAEAAPVQVALVETTEAVEDVQTDLLDAASAASAAPEGLLTEAPTVIDDLKLIKGVGPKLEAELNGIGIYTFAQIATMTEAQIVWLDEQISSVRGRPMRDDWAGQAKALAG
jgi:NADH-quinone oxidoreductase subunit E